MTVMVDEIRKYPNAKGVFMKGSAHLTVDGTSPSHLEELHAFAESIGLKRDWFQDHPLAPHYDLAPSKHAMALTKGAVFVSAKEQARRRIRLRNEI